MTLDEFLIWSDQQPHRYEYIDGQAVLLPGSTQQRAVLKSDIIAALHVRLRGSGYRILSAMHIVLSMTEVRYPSVIVDSGPFDADATEPSAPVLIIDIGQDRDWSAIPSARYLYVPDDADADTATNRAVLLIRS